MLARLNKLFQRHGYIPGLVIDETDGLPSSGAYSHRFGSLLRAYELVGFKPDRDYRYIEINRLLRAFHASAVDHVMDDINRLGGTITRHAATGLLTLNEEFSASIVVARCRQTNAGTLRWKVRFGTGLAPDITIAIRMDRSNEAAFKRFWPLI